MASGDIYLYDLVSCGLHFDITNVATSVVPSPFDGAVVYLIGAPQSQTYVVTPVTPPANGLNAGVLSGWMPNIAASSLTSCADPNSDKMYRVYNCSNTKENRYVLLSSSQTIGDILRFVGECTCWVVDELISTYTESPVIDTVFNSCEECQGVVEAEICTYEERTIGRAIKIKLPQPEPPDRGFKECCYSNIVFGDLADTDPYKNDYSSVFFQRQTDTDTVTFELVGQSTGVTALIDGTHGELYPISATNNNPNLTWFRVDWRKILSTLGIDVFRIRMNQTIAGVGPTVIDSNSFDLRPFSVSGADNTVRIDGAMDGTMEKINVNFKESGYKNALRVQGFFGNAQDNAEQDTVVFSSKKGKRYYSDQITMRNDPEYIFQANNIPECISRELRKFIIFSNDIFISDYNLNNHSYEYRLLPVELSEINANDYPVRGRGVNIEMTFKDKSKDNIKTNCK